MLVAVRWWCVAVSTEHVSSSVYAGLGVIVITELSRTVIAPWGSFRVSWREWSNVGASWLRCRWDRAEVAVGRVLGQVAGLQLCGRVGPQVLED